MYKKIIIIVFLLLLTGCKSEEYYTCTIDVDNYYENYNFSATYKIYYEDRYVTKIEKEETYRSNDMSVIDYFDEYKNLDYNNLNDLYGGFNYTISKTENSLSINAVIDIKDVNVKEMIKNGYLDKEYTISNKLTTSGIKYFYRNKGAICD